MKRTSAGATRNLASAEAILVAAQQVLVEEGYGGFTIDKVARRAKAGKATIYRWWPSRTALLLDVYLRQKSITFQNTGQFDDDLVAFIDAILTNWRETPSGEIFRSIIAEAQSSDEANAPLAQFAAERQSDTSVLILQAIQQGDVGAATDPMRVARWIGSYLWYRLLTDQLSVSQEDIRDDVQILLTGITG